MDTHKERQAGLVEAKGAKGWKERANYMIEVHGRTIAVHKGMNRSSYNVRAAHPRGDAESKPSCCAELQEAYVPEI